MQDVGLMNHLEMVSHSMTAPTVDELVFESWCQVPSRWLEADQMWLLHWCRVKSALWYQLENSTNVVIVVLTSELPGPSSVENSMAAFGPCCGPMALVGSGGSDHNHRGGRGPGPPPACAPCVHFGRTLEWALWTAWTNCDSSNCSFNKRVMYQDLILVTRVSFESRKSAVDKGTECSDQDTVTALIAVVWLPLWEFPQGTPCSQDHQGRLKPCRHARCLPHQKPPSAAERVRFSFSSCSQN